MIVNNLHFKKAMAVVEAARQARNPIPVLGTIRAVHNEEGLTVEATDLDMTFTATVPAEPGGDHLDRFLISDPRGVVSAINAAGGSNVQIEAIRPDPADDNSKGVNHKVAFQSGDLVLAQSNGIPEDDFPQRPAVREEVFATEFSAATLQQIARVFPAISTEETRYYLNGVNMKKLDGTEWTYRFCATDGHRLFVIDIPLPSSTGEFSDAIIPRRYITAVTKQMSKSKEAMPFQIGNATASNAKPNTTAPDSRAVSRISLAGKLGDMDVTFDGKLIDGTYPDYSRVIPSEDALPRYANVNLTDMRRAVMAVSMADSAKTIRALKLEFDKTGFTVSRMIGHSGKNDATFRIDCIHNCAGMTAGFNGKYLLETLNAFKGEEVNIGLGEPSKDENSTWFNCVADPTLFRDPSDTDFFVVLMPMRI